MIYLAISPNHPDHRQIVERLETLSLARKVKEDSQLKEPILSHNGKQFEGTKAILSYLEEFESFMNEWYACLCD